MLPFFWLWGPEEGVEEAILETRAVRDLEVLSRTDDGRLYRATWHDAVEGFVRGISDTGATIMQRRGTSDGWQFELRFAEREEIRRFRTYCRDNDIAVEIDRIYTVSEGEANGGYELTDAQRETLRQVYVTGYFEQPRGTTQSELAATFDVSQRAISRRLRSGLSTLVGNTVAAGIELKRSDASWSRYIPSRGNIYLGSVRRRRYE